MAKKSFTYKEAVQELENILRELENNEAEVDELTAKVKRAAELIRFCKSKLFETDKEIEKIIRNLDEPDND
jgi:exodeoxyribonuclease VII small subunit